MCKQYPIVRDIVHEVDQLGGRVFLVGGAVRDLFLGVPIKDFDIEIHGVTLEELEALLGRYGEVNLVGKSFGVLRLSDLPIDFAVPRSDKPGRKPIVTLDPHMAIADAFARRDLTINAMGIDLKTGQLVDPFGGKEDLKAGILRAPNADFFKEDPLRFFRVMQFISRFGMVPDQQLDEISKKIDIKTVSKERIETEFEKMLLKSKRPSLGLRWLARIGRLKEVLPELAAVMGIEQGIEYHPEGDVFEHTMQTVDAAAQLPIESEFKRRIMMYAALCHDLGKVSTTERADDGRITSIGHDVVGAGLSKQMLKRIMDNKELMIAVAKLVHYHMAPIQFTDNGAKAPAYKRLANKLAPHASLEMLADLSLADYRGRNPDGQLPLKTDSPMLQEFRDQARKAQVYDTIEQPLLSGRDIIDIVEPGPRMGQLLNLAYEIQLDEGISDKQKLKKRLQEKIN